MEPDNPIETTLEEGKRKWGLFCETFTIARGNRASIQLEANRIVNVIRLQQLPCPLTYYFMEEISVRAGFENLKGYVGEWVDRTHESIKAHSGKWWLPSLFRGKPRQFVTKPVDWWRIDVIVDWFTEYERVLAKKEYADSPNEVWNDNKSLMRIVVGCSRKAKLDCATLRDGIYHASRELGLFRCTRAKSLVVEIFAGQSTAGKRWLDMSSGWGDRLLTACALEMDYLGIDPNNNLEYGHSKMIKMFGNGRQRVVYQPFQTAESVNVIHADVEKNGQFDLSLISPPFYIIERYRGEGQSTDTYPELNDWIVKFLFKSLHIIWTHLKDGGYLAVNMANLRDCDITCPMQLFIEDCLMGCQWEGMLPFSGKNLNDIHGITYVWRKRVDCKTTLWKPHIARSLKEMFPDLYNLWLQEQESPLSILSCSSRDGEKKDRSKQPELKESTRFF